MASAEAAAPQFGALRARHVLAPDGPRYIEGSVWHLWTTQSFPGRALDVRLLSDDFRVKLARGTYVLHSEEFPCDANCGTLDPPQNRCARRIAIRGGRTTNVRVTLRADRGCTISLG
jgi:hypothetical protein